jgi:hypothetical protein
MWMPLSSCLDRVGRAEICIIRTCPKRIASRPRRQSNIASQPLRQQEDVRMGSALPTILNDAIVAAFVVRHLISSDG